ncbi:MAG: S4 domain-containing protein [Eggerthellaceae bacterium]
MKRAGEEYRSRVLRQAAARRPGQFLCSNSMPCRTTSPVRSRPHAGRRRNHVPGEALADAGLAASAGEARRLIDGGGVKVNGEALPAKSYNVDPALLAGATLQVGKRKFVKLV